MNELELIDPVVIGYKEGRGIAPENITDIIQDLILADAMTPEGQYVNIWLYTAGGDNEAALALYDAIRGLESPSRIVCMGQVMSSGLIVLQAATERVAFPHCTFMHHCLSQESTALTPETAIMVFNSYIRNQNLGNKIIRSRMTVTDETWLTLWENSTGREFTAKEAVELGVVDRVVEKLSEIYNG